MAQTKHEKHTSKTLEKEANKKKNPKIKKRKQVSTIQSNLYLKIKVLSEHEEDLRHSHVSFQKHHVKQKHKT